METATILVIDDDQTICDACYQVYRKNDYRVGIAMDGTSGLQKARELKPDIVLVDLKMPGISGMEVLDEIRRIDPTIVSIVITGYASMGSAIEAMRNGAHDFLPKPFTPDDLRSIAKRGLERRQLVLESLGLRQEKEKMKELAISMVSHQLRSRLTAVQGYFNLILGDFVSDKTEQRKMIKQANERIEGLLALINDWLKMAEIDKGRLDDKFGCLDLGSVLSESIDLMQPLAKDNGVSLRFGLSDCLPIVWGDKGTLREVFTNLVENAIKYNKHGGSVLISIKENESHVFIEFSDTGIGIPEADIPFIFDAFSRVRNEETQQIKGTGLGLSIVKRMVEAHSGSIKVTSELSKGSVFTVTLPKPAKQKVEIHSKKDRDGFTKENSDN